MWLGKSFIRIDMMDPRAAAPAMPPMNLKSGVQVYIGSDVFKGVENKMMLKLELNRLVAQLLLLPTLLIRKPNSIELIDVNAQCI